MRIPLFQNLNARLAVVVMGLFILAIGLLSVITTTSLKSEIKNLLSEQQFSSASYVADDIEQRVRLRLDALSIITREIDRPLLNDAEKLQDLLAHRPLLRSLFGIGVTVISASGSAVTAYPASTYSPTLTFNDIEYFEQVMVTGKPTVGKPRIGRVTHKPVIGFAAPIFAPSGEIIGVLVGFSLLSDPTLFGSIEKTKVGNGGWIAVSAPTYKLIVSSSDHTRILDRTAEPGVNKMFDQFSNGYEGSGISVNSKGIETLTSAKQIPSAGWFAQVVLPTSEAFAPISNMIIRTYTLALVIALMVATWAWWLIRKMLFPLAKTGQQIMEMAEGKKPLTTIRIDRDDEIGAVQQGFNHLVHARNKIEAHVHEQSRHIAELSQHLMRAQEEERRRLALDIHDIVSPNVATIKIQLKMLATDLMAQGQHEQLPQLEDVHALIEDTEASLRGICADLRPAVLDYSGLAPALEEYAQQFSARTGIVVNTLAVHADERLPLEVETKLFRIAQEALTNSAKHARPTSIDIHWNLGPNNGVLTIVDNGAGFEMQSLSAAKTGTGLGLLTMRERAEFVGGQFSMESSPGKGTRITVEVMRRNPDTSLMLAFG